MNKLQGSLEESRLKNMGTITVNVSDANVTINSYSYLADCLMGKGYVFVKQSKGNVNYREFIETKTISELRIRVYTSGRVLIFTQIETEDMFPTIGIKFDGFCPDAVALEYLLSLIKTKI